MEELYISSVKQIKFILKGISPTVVERKITSRELNFSTNVNSDTIEHSLDVMPMTNLSSTKGIFL